MRIGIDIDDTITDTYVTIMEYISKDFNVPLEYIYKKGITYLDMYQDKEHFPHFGEYVKENFPKAISLVPCKENVSKVIKRLKDEGHEIIIMTARDCAYPGQNEEFLKRHEIPYDAIYDGVFEKGKKAKELKLDIFFDDSYIHYEQLEKENIDVYLFDAPFNIKYKEARRVKNWNEVYEVINNKCTY